MHGEGSARPSRRNDDSAREVFYSVGGLTSRPDPTKDVHLRWKFVAPLRIGDRLEIKILEVKKADRPKSWKKAERRRK
jgi:hypothetical protein